VDRSTKTTYRLDDKGTLFGTEVSERRVRYSIENRGNDSHAVTIEHRPTDQEWLPEPKQDSKVKHSQASFRYLVECPKESLVTHDVVEIKRTISKWSQETSWSQLQQLTLDKDMSPEIRDRLRQRIVKLAEIDALQGDLSNLSLSRERALAEQQRIKTLMMALNRGDELHARYLKKLSVLENEIESTTEKQGNLRRQLDDFKSRLSPQAIQ
jgi:hypothetical protein